MNKAQNNMSEKSKHNDTIAHMRLMGPNEVVYNFV